MAAQVYDKTRFRIVTRPGADILPVLYFLTQRLFPFNFLVPGQTENTLLPFKSLLHEYPHFRQHAHELHLDLDFEDREGAAGNEFSGSGYRALNFVVDVPLRLDEWLPPPELDRRERKGRIGFTLVEFQLVDVRTAGRTSRGRTPTTATSSGRSCGCCGGCRGGWSFPGARSTGRRGVGSPE